MHAFMTNLRALLWRLMAWFLENASPLVDHKKTWFPESSKGQWGSVWLIGLLLLDCGQPGVDH